MFDKFTKSAYKMLDLAVQNSRKYGRSDIGSEMILTGLVEEENGVAALALNTIGLTHGNMLSFLKTAYPDANPNTHETGVDLDGSSNTRLLLELAWDEHNKDGSEYIASDHILRGLLRLKDSKAHDVFAAYKIEPAQVLEAISSNTNMRPPSDSKKCEVG
jgi:ATP-dependent Clp protease ATP-binding subunit ClpC